MNPTRIPKINDKIKVDHPEIDPIKECKILSIILDSIFVRPKCSRQTFEVKRNQIIGWCNEETLTGKQKEQIIRKLVKEELLKGDYKIMHRELHFFKQLLASYPDLDFWLNFQPATRVLSMAQYMGANKDALRFQYNQATLNLDAPKKEIEQFSNTKIGEDIVTKRKSRNLFDILR